MKRLLALSAVGLGLSMLSGAHQAPKGQPDFSFHPVPDGQKAPIFDAFTPAGKKVNLSDFKGKVVILDFWASWCGPCQQSMPGLEKIYQQEKN